MAHRIWGGPKRPLQERALQFQPLDRKWYCFGQTRWARFGTQTQKRLRGTHWALSPELGEGQNTHWVRCLKLRNRMRPVSKEKFVSKVGNPCPTLGQLLTSRILYVPLVGEKQHKIARARFCTQSCSNVGHLLVNSSPTPQDTGSCEGLPCSGPLAIPEVCHWLTGPAAHWLHLFGNQRVLGTSALVHVIENRQVETCGCHKERRCCRWPILESSTCTSFWQLTANLTGKQLHFTANNSN